MLTHIATFTTDLRAPIKFRYTNHRGDSHVYMVLVESITFTDREVPNQERYESLQPDRETVWLLNGQLITRDGDSRPEMGPTRRRSFELLKMEMLEVPIS